MSSEKKNTRVETVPASKLYVMADEDSPINTSVPVRESEAYADWGRDRDE